MNFNLFNNYKIIISIGLLIVISILQKLNKSKTVTITSIDTQSTNIIRSSHNNNNKVRFILYFAHWCGHCKAFLPIWNEFKKNNTNSDIEISEVDCEKNNGTCSNNNIDGFPTAKLYKNDEEIEYTNERTIEGLNTFINEHC